MGFGGENNRSKYDLQNTDHIVTYIEFTDKL